MQTTAQVIERAAAEVRGGRAWRAREILLGNIHSRSYKQHSSEPGVLDLDRVYGELLVKLGDTMEGGRYLFLSGFRGAETDGAVELYLSRFKRAAPVDLVRSFPASARLEKIADYPKSTARELGERGVTDTSTASRGERPTLESISAGGGFFATLAAFAVMLMFIAPWLIGVGAVIYWTAIFLAYLARLAT